MSFVLCSKKKYTDGDKLISVFYLLGAPVYKKIKAPGFVKKYLFGIKVSKLYKQPGIAFSGGGNCLLDNKMIYGEEVKNIARSVGIGLKVNNPSWVTPNTELGDFVNFNGMRITGGGKCKIGSYFHSGAGCKILTENHNYNKGTEIPYDSTYVYKDVVIEDFVWLGIDVIILPGTIIREGAIIQAGAVVHGEIPRCAIAGGNPAKVFAYRDIEHFDKLKEEKKFH